MGDSTAAKSQKSSESLDYVEVPRQLPKPQETFQNKFIRKTKENPLVPIGV